MLQYTQLIETVNCLLEIKSETNLISKSLGLSPRYSTVWSLLLFHNQTLNLHSYKINTRKGCNKQDWTVFPMTLNSHALQHRESFSSAMDVVWFLSRLCNELHIRSNEVLIRWNDRFRFRGGGGGGRGAEVEIVMTCRKAWSDLRQISAEMSGVHPVVTLTYDSSAVLEFNLRSTTG